MLINSYAKINLYLEVLELTPSNYHEIDTVYCSVDLHDTLRFALTKTPSVKLLSNLPEMVSPSNLVYLTAKQLLDTYSPDIGVEIYLDKVIPLAAGLGGGSSNAAVTILALNELWNLGLSTKTMFEIGSEIGSDVPYFLLGGTARGTGRGNVIQSLDSAVIDKILLVNPNVRISSKEAYTLYDISQEQMSVPRGKSSRKYFNRLEDEIKKNYADVRFIVEHLHSMGAIVSMMSGSGSTCFGIFDSEMSMRASQEFFTQRGYWTKITRTITRDEYKECFQN